MQAVDLPGIASADQSRMQLYDKVFVAPPVGAVAPERELYLSYRLGPLIEDFGQIVIPTGVIEVTRPRANGEAAIGRVVKMFGEVLQDQRLIALDSSAAIVRGAPIAVIERTRRQGPLDLQHSRCCRACRTISSSDIPQGDVESRRSDRAVPAAPASGRRTRRSRLPEMFIARAQVLRVTPYGATAIITSQEQPKIEEGTAARVAAKIP